MRHFLKSIITIVLVLGFLFPASSFAAFDPSIIPNEAVLTKGQKIVRWTEVVGESLGRWAADSWMIRVLYTTVKHPVIFRVGTFAMKIGPKVAGVLAFLGVMHSSGEDWSPEYAARHRAEDSLVDTYIWRLWYYYLSSDQYKNKVRKTIHEAYALLQNKMAKDFGTPLRSRLVEEKYVYLAMTPRTLLFELENEAFPKALNVNADMFLGPHAVENVAADIARLSYVIVNGMDKAVLKKDFERRHQRPLTSQEVAFEFGRYMCYPNCYDQKAIDKLSAEFISEMDSRPSEKQISIEDTVNYSVGFREVIIPYKTRKPEAFNLPCHPDVDSRDLFMEELPKCEFFNLSYLMNQGLDELNVKASKEREVKNDLLNGAVMFTQTMALFALDHFIQKKIPFFKNRGIVTKALTSLGVFSMGYGVLGSLALRDPSLTLVAPLDHKYGEQQSETVLSLLAKAMQYAERDNLDPDQVMFHLAKLVRNAGKDAKLVRSTESVPK